MLKRCLAIARYQAEQNQSFRYIGFLRASRSGENSFVNGTRFRIAMPVKKFGIGN
jgi:hypothetical protein